ncbi:hypothetical protein [Niabella sp.]|uniref:hypothetical protein n=1 Tax=Niabella sp. TaxID=1962976 RepID=UPI0026127ADE|nr:hypothetical protein [Niabella sp.]
MNLKCWRNQVMPGFFLICITIIGAGWIHTPIPSQKTRSNKILKVSTEGWTIIGTENVTTGSLQHVYEASSDDYPNVDPPDFWEITGGHIVFDSHEWKIWVVWDNPGTGTVAAYRADSTLLASETVYITGNPPE